METIVERKICPLSGEEFSVTDRDLIFYDSISPIFNGKKYLVPSPTLCPHERQRRILTFRNEGKLYHRICDLSHKPIISMYTPECPKKVYHHELWWTSAWDPLDYGATFDFSKDFFTQFYDLFQAVPVPALHNSNNENSAFNNHIMGCRDCYMCAVAYYGTERALYSQWVYNSHDIIDGKLIYDSENCYECVQAKLCYGCRYCLKSNNCTDCFFSQYLIGCQDCLLCTNLTQKKYHIFNKPVTPEVYVQQKKEFLELPREKQMTLWRDFATHQFVPAVYSFKCERCSGDGMIGCSDSYECFDVEDLERCKYIHGGSHMKNAYDGIGGTLENCYEFCRAGVVGNQCCFVIDAMNSSDIWYSAHIYNAANCFGCVGLHMHEHHCIFNTPYSVHEYEELAGKIIDHMRTTGEWGEFFPHEFSPYGYNETDAQEYFPLTESEVRGMPRFSQWKDNTIIDNAIIRGDANITGKPKSYYPLSGLSSASRGWNWYPESSKPFEGPSITPLPIQDYDEKKVGYEIAQRNIDELLNGIILCVVSKKPFKIIRQELVFYIENGIPIPTRHPDVRRKERTILRNPRTLYTRTCTDCGVSIETTFAPNRPEKVVCEECYRKLVYS